MTTTARHGATTAIAIMTVLSRTTPETITSSIVTYIIIIINLFANNTKQ